MYRWSSIVWLLVSCWGVATEPVPAATKSHWAFVPVSRPPLPKVQHRERLQQPIDAFVLGKLEAAGLQPNPPASRRELIRRAYFDVLGLPPSPEAVAAFEHDASPDAWERVVDRLLASPQYGERWGRHWLDIVRFGQTHGYERDAEKPHAWRYRDYVIRSLNADKPFDRFVLEQLAGDEIDPKNDDAVIATGFYRLGVWDDEPDDQRQAEFDNLDEVLATIGEAFLGITIGCARCHEHKYDPIPHDEYYGLLAFVRGIRPGKFIQADDPTILTKLSTGEPALAVQENGATPKPTPILLRGLAATPGKEVSPRFPKALTAQQVPAIRPNSDKSSGRRRALADWIASPTNPLTARVIVNRVWQHHFGRGLVVTPNDFGKNGAVPTHPDLLDYLASELIANGWRLKPIHRMIVLSTTWQQSSKNAEFGMRNAELKKVSGPARRLYSAFADELENKLLWRQNMRRVEAEAVRDALLSVTGQLNSSMGGRGIFPELPPEVLATQSKPGNGWGKSSAREQARRSVYIFVKRTLGVPILETFDCANPDKSIATRVTTTVAPQALILLNSAFMDEQAKALADRLQRECGADTGKQIDRAFQLALARTPTERERQIAGDYMRRSSLAAFCKLVLNLNEFVYVD